jgi:hypothetical protein
MNAITTQPDPLHVIYINRLATDKDYRAFGAVSRTARTHNPALECGRRAFVDGERFCQWPHGSGEVVSRLLTAIALDRRHVDFKLLHLGVSDVTPAISGWCNGFVAPFALDVLDVLDVLDSKMMGSAEVLPVFMNVLAEALLSPRSRLIRTQKRLSSLDEIGCEDSAAVRNFRRKSIQHAPVRASVYKRP